MGAHPNLSSLRARRQWLSRAVACLIAGAAATRTSTSRADLMRWPYERQLGVVALHADFSLDAHATLFDEIQQLDDQLGRHLEIPAPREPVHLILFRQRSTYQAYLQEHYPRVPYRRALYIKDRGPGIVMAYRSPELEVDVRHETTHAILHASLPEVPLWLDEGLAEYYEVAASQRARGHDHLPATRWATRWAATRPLEELEGLKDIESMGPQEYQRAWSWIHFCMHGPTPAKRVLTDYLGALADSETGPPLSHRLRRHWPELESRLVQHFRSF